MNRQLTKVVSIVVLTIASIAASQEGTMTDSRDGQVYKTVKIGEQVWMAQNLNYAYYGREAEKDSSSFCYNDSAEYCAKYGRLYTWAAAMDSAQVLSDASSFCGYGGLCYARGKIRGVCPEGWHLPSIWEREKLIASVGDSSIAGTALKSVSGWAPHVSVPEGSDTYGFAVFPAGFRADDGHFGGMGYSVYFWLSNENSKSYAYVIGLSYKAEKIKKVYVGKDDALSVRCLKDSN